MVTIIVSPMAREMPSTNAATMPDTAAGTTTRVATCIFDEAERVRALPQAVRHGAHRVLGEAGDGRDDHDAHDDAGDEQVLERPARCRRARVAAGAG